MSPKPDVNTEDLQRTVVDLRRELERARTERDEALDQQSATAEVLGVINASPGDLAPVFETILEKAHSLCGAEFGALLTYDGESVRLAAERNLPPAWADIVRGPWLPRHDHPVSRIIRGERLFQLNDMAEVARTSDDPVVQAAVKLGGIRSLVLVPLHKDNAFLGYITAYRQEVRPFSDKEIALLQNFAAQAVIAMENARLITETREALERQTATAEVLGIINSNPGDLGPVFDAVLDKALMLCRAAFGVLWTYDGEFSRASASRGATDVYREFLSKPHRPGPGSAQLRLIQGEMSVHVADLADSEDYRSGDELPRALVDLGGGRTLLAVPLRKDGAYLGAIMIYRQEVHSFSDKEIALLQNFAAQAVIAMENARLITETREALDQQTATAEVLGAINASPGDLAPVFEAMLDKAMRLCEADVGWLLTEQDGEFRFAAGRGLPKPFAEYLQRMDQPRRNEANSRLQTGDVPFVHVTDMKDAVYESGSPFRRAVVDLGGVRTGLAMALRKDGRLLGTFNLARREIRPFTDKQTSLVQNFAAQAVIAMENARLITETREALDQQTATAEVLQVINSSPGNLAPVFDAMLAKAMRLCQAEFGELDVYDGQCSRVVATLGVPADFDEHRKKNPSAPRPGSFGGRFLAGETVIHIVDLTKDELYIAGNENRRAIVELGRARTVLVAPLRRDECLLGFIILYRQEVRRFTDQQISLLQNFAAQAVIAMENARLLDEIRQRQAELRVTFDNMADGVAMFDEELRLTAWNRNFQELLDLPDALLAERPAFDTHIRYLTERGEFGDTAPEDEIARLRSRLTDHYSFERTRPDGTVIEVRHNPMPDGGVVLIYSDITERKRSEDEIRSARDAAEIAYHNLQAAQANLVQAQKMAALGQLTAGIAHEIKNPLNFVNNFASLSVELLDELKETTAPALATLDEDKRADVDDTMELLTGNLEKIAEHGKRADNIVKSMLEHSRDVSGERREVDLNGVIDEALNLAYHGARAQDQNFNITLERDYAESLRPLELAPQEMTRVFLNLFGNGFYAANKRARDNGDNSFRPILSVRTRENGDGVEVRVRDNGIGIPPEIRDKLFQPFFTTKPTGEGTGLGLSISYDIVTHQHGGTITVESEPGAYTEFTVRLPRQQPKHLGESA